MSLFNFRNAVHLVVAIDREIKRYPEKRQRKIEKRKSEKSVEAAAAAELETEQRALIALIKQRDFKIDKVEMTNVLGYYVLQGATLPQAHRNYCSLLNRGQRLPSSIKNCEEGGRILRKRLDMLTAEDQVFLDARYLKSDRFRVMRALLIAIVILLCGTVLAYQFENFGIFVLSSLGAFILVIFAWLLNKSVQRRSRKS